MNFWEVFLYKKGVKTNFNLGSNMSTLSCDTTVLKGLHSTRWLKSKNNVWCKSYNKDFKFGWKLQFFFTFYWSSSLKLSFFFFLFILAFSICTGLFCAAFLQLFIFLTVPVGSLKKEFHRKIILHHFDNNFRTRL